MATRLENIAAANPGVGANDAFIQAVYLEAFNRNATPAELQRFRGTRVKDVANIVLRDRSPFASQNIAPVSQPAPAPQTAEDIVNQLFGPTGVSSIIAQLRQQREPAARAAAEAQFNPFFQRLTAEAEQEAGLAQSRLAEDLGQFEQNQQLQEGVNRQQEIGAFNQRLGEAFGSPLQQQQEALRQQARNQSLTQTRQGFARRQFDVGEILRKRRDELEQSRLGEISSTVQSDLDRLFT
jgi:hypothetical protein